MGRLTLVTGGSRSGKSTFALEMAEKTDLPRVFVATSPKIDPEYDERICAHQKERGGRNWQTVEEETDLVSALRAVSPQSVLLVDCLTLWVNNLMYAAESTGNPLLSEDTIRKEAERFLSAVENTPHHVICVTNEVGWGIVPENALSRRYRDLVGRLNQIVAAKADAVWLVSCGLPLCLKPSSSNS